MRRRALPGCRIAGLAAVGLIGAAPARAQSLEPRAYSPAPVGMNFVIAGWAWTDGGLAFDSSAPITNPKLETTGPILAYARTLDVFGRSGKLDVILPAGRISGSALFRGEPVRREVTGLYDPLARVSVILVGAPAMTPAEFRSYRQDLTVGASLQLSVPVGQYDANRLVNLGTNRWIAKPEIGVSKTWGRWTLEADAAAVFYGDNDDFFGGRRRTQRPLYAARGHAVYSFASGVWASVDGTWFTGGETRLDGVPQDDMQRNWRVGATVSIPIDRRRSMKFYVSRGVSARTGNNFDLLGMAWQARWGAGL
jgi:hypothetical protein